jgi:hypothetical protein
VLEKKSIIKIVNFDLWQNIGKKKWKQSDPSQALIKNCRLGLIEPVHAG